MIIFATKIQKLISNNVKIEHLGLENVNRICGLDVAYKQNFATAVCVVQNVRTGEVYYKYVKEEVNFPYIPGYLFMREAPLMLQLLEEINCDLILVDGHGLSHPRRSGIATVIGVLENKPSIGVAKSKLFGDVIVEDGVSYIVVENMKVGIKVGKYYFSIGNMVDLNDVIQLSSKGYPLVLKEADKLSKKISNS
jgi:deoxyribonuclease V